MRRPTHSGGSETLSSHGEIQKTITDIEDALGGINEDLSYAAPNFDGIIAFSNTVDELIATPVAKVDAIGSNGYQHDFRDTWIMDYRIRKTGTDLVDLGVFTQNPINPDAQMTYTLPLLHEGAQVGLIQHSFTEHYKDEAISLPDNEQLETIWRNHAKDVTLATAGILRLQEMARQQRKLLPVMLHKKPAWAPNSYQFHWDVAKSTEIVNGERQPIFDDFLNDAHLEIADLIQQYVDDPQKSHWAIREAYGAEGDGAFVVLMLPDGYNTYDTQVLRTYEHYVARQVMFEAARRLEALTSRLPDDFRPKIFMSGDFGHVEMNSVGRLVSTTMTRLSAEQKRKQAEI